MNLGLVTLAREPHGSRYGWRVSFPGGGSLVSLGAAVAALPSGAMLNLWTSLPPLGETDTGLCTAKCSGKGPDACGAFTSNTTLAATTWAHAQRSRRATATNTCLLFMLFMLRVLFYIQILVV